MTCPHISIHPFSRLPTSHFLSCKGKEGLEVVAVLTGGWNNTQLETYESDSLSHVCVLWYCIFYEGEVSVMSLSCIHCYDNCCNGLVRRQTP